MDNNYNNIQPQTNQPVDEQVQKYSTMALVFGLLSFALAGTILFGIIFGIMGLVFAKKAKNANGTMPAMAGVGVAMSWSGIGIIIFTFLLVIVISAIAIMTGGV